MVYFKAGNRQCCYKNPVPGFGLVFHSNTISVFNHLEIWISQPLAVPLNKVENQTVSRRLEQARF
jgi:hypothetical protein